MCRRQQGSLAGSTTGSVAGFAVPDVDDEGEFVVGNAFEGVGCSDLFLSAGGGGTTLVKVDKRHDVKRWMPE